MAEMSNNDIEKQLRDYAAQRRDAAGTPRMHPATRQTLQAEAKQQFGSLTRPARPRVWLALWPRFAAALGMLAIIAVAMLVIEKQSHAPKPFELAEAPKPVAAAASAPPTKTEPALKKEAADGLAEASRTDGHLTPGGFGFNREGKADLAKDLSATAFAAAVPAAEPVVPASEAGAVQAKAGSGGRMDPNPPTGAKLGTIATSAVSENQSAYKYEPVQSRTMNAMPQPLATAAPQAQQAPFAESALNSGTQRFRNTETQPSAMGGAAQTRAVLDEFTFAQNGSQLRIVDRDGSIYNGYVRPATSEEANYNLNNFAVNNARQNQASPALYNVSPAQAQGLDPASNNTPLGTNTVALADAVTQAPDLGAAQNFMFEVEGTNRSLRQRVIFNGNLIQNTGNISVQNQNGPVNSQNYRRQDQSMPVQNAVSQQLQNNYINGRVYLGNSRSGTELNALSTDQ